jgi:hypothetical protein
MKPEHHFCQQLDVRQTANRRSHDAMGLPVDAGTGFV